MRIGAIFTPLLFISLTGEATPPSICPLPASPLATYGKNRVWALDDGLVYGSSILKVDADGAPDSYRVDGKGLSYTCDGVVAIENGKRVTPDSDPKHWQEKCLVAWKAAVASSNYSNVDIFGFEKDKDGLPVVQKEGDPLPGDAFVTTTWVNIPGAALGTQRRYVDATAIPYVVIPGKFRALKNIPDGAVAAVYRPITGKIAFAVFGDTGGALNEASVRLHEDLGGKPIRVIRGVRRATNNIDDQVIVVILPKTIAVPRTDATAWRADIATKGADALKAWGGEARLKACKP